MSVFKFALRAVGTVLMFWVAFAPSAIRRRRRRHRCRRRATHRGWLSRRPGPAGRHAVS